MKNQPFSARWRVCVNHGQANLPMDKILKCIAKETQGECFTSYKFCFDTEELPHLLYGDVERGLNPLANYAEDNQDPRSRDMGPMAKKCMESEPLFHFFLDGSRRVYKVDDIQYGNKVYPVVSGQISVACCERQMREKVRFGSFRHVEEEVYSVLSLPVKANADGQDDRLFFNNLCKKVREKSLGERAKLKKVLHYSTYDTKDSLEDKAIAMIQDDMIECEKKIVADLTAKSLLSQDSYLIKDGSIQYKTMKTGDFRELAKIRNNYRHVVGVSKSFNPDLMRDKKNRSNAGEIARLPLFHRTPAFMWEPGNACAGERFAIWYLRIRDSRYTATPYSGVLKVEKLLVTDSEREGGLSSDEIDNISANIINERNPVCYGVDTRWANHLYPVYMTERYCKSRFFSDSYFINLF